ncbi:hypothetical protein C8R46DRAFT_1296798 [Mycena filopes]|nr:hypothetical protein C8R46DRAFT_1296798 [Mycena filopes]
MSQKLPRRTPATTAPTRGPATARTTRDHDDGSHNDHHAHRGNTHASSNTPPVHNAHANHADGDYDQDIQQTQHHLDHSYDYHAPGAGAVNEADDEDEDDAPVRGRVRRVTEKQAQMLEELEAAEMRKAERTEKAVKATKKRALKAAGLDDDEVMEPRPNNEFTSRTVDSRPKTTKALAQRDSKLPPPPPKFPSSSWRPTGSSPAQGSSSTQSRRHSDDRDNRRDGRDNGREDHDNIHDTQDHPTPQPTHRQRHHSRSRSPMYNINGGRVPDHVRLNLFHHSDDENDDIANPRPGRSPSQVAGDKRKRSPEDDDMRTAQAQRTSTATGRPKARDYDDVTQELLALSIKLYRCCLASRHPFPDHAMELELVREVWATACTMLNISMQLSPTLSKLITNRGTHFRGEGKTKIRPIVEVGYGFKSGQDKKTIAHNRQLAESLKEDLTFVFKPKRQDIMARKGMYRTPLIQQAINALYFANRRDEGPSYPDVFNPFPIVALAFILAVFLNCIDEWATGTRVDIPFTASEYRSVYESQHQALLEFQEQTEKHKILDGILTRLHNVGRFHSGAQPLVTINKSVLKKADVAAALKEFEEGEETETDGEFGERD